MRACAGRLCTSVHSIEKTSRSGCGEAAHFRFRSFPISWAIGIERSIVRGTLRMRRSRGFTMNLPKNSGVTPWSALVAWHDTSAWFANQRSYDLVAAALGDSRDRLPYGTERLMVLKGSRPLSSWVQFTTYAPEAAGPASRRGGVQRGSGYSGTTSLPLRIGGAVIVGLAKTAQKMLVALASVLTHPIDQEDLPTSLRAAASALVLAAPTGLGPPDPGRSRVGSRCFRHQPDCHHGLDGGHKPACPTRTQDTGIGA